MTAANVISLSGGKDSVATALVAIESEAKNISFVFADTSHEHDETYKYIEYLDGELIKRSGVGITVVKANFQDDIDRKRNNLIAHREEVINGREGNRRLKNFTVDMLDRMINHLNPTGNAFLDLCLLKGRFPGTRSRFCSEELKHKPIEKYHESLMGEYTAVVSWQGVRRAESKARADLAKWDVEFGSWEPQPEGLLIYRPIIDWSANQCFEMHVKHGIKPNPLYKKGMGRVGCMPCIHCTKSEMREIQRRYPEIIERIAEMERLVSLASKMGASTFFDARVTAKYLGTGKTIDDIKTDTHGINTFVEWAMTEHGGRQKSLIYAIELDDIPVCSSVYGLCE